MSVDLPAQLEAAAREGERFAAQVTADLREVFARIPVAADELDALAVQVGDVAGSIVRQYRMEAASRAFRTVMLGRLRVMAAAVRIPAASDALIALAAQVEQETP